VRTRRAPATPACSSSSP